MAVFGAGPVGLMAAYSGVLRGASKVYVVDKVKERLNIATKIGATPIDFSKGDPVEQIIEINGTPPRLIPCWSCLISNT